MTSTFCTPICKKTYYISQPKNSIYIDIIDTVIKNKIKLQNNKGYIFTTFINKETKQNIDNIDEISRNVLISENEEWFSNNLDTSEITELFKSSYCNQNNTLNIYLTEKSIIEYENKIIEQDLLNDILSDKKWFNEYVINIKIQNIGMYIYPTHTINKWGIKNMKIFKIENENLENAEKRDIELFWKEQLEHCKQILDEKQNIIIEQKKNIDDLYQSIINEESQNKEWESKFAHFMKKIQNIIF